MKIIRAIRQLFQRLERRFLGDTQPSVAPLCDLGTLTTTGLPLRQALSVRSGEYWFALGQPDCALRELQTLPHSARRHPWAWNVQLQAIHEAGGGAGKA